MFAVESLWPLMVLFQFAGRALPDTERPCRSLSLFLIRSLFLSSPPGKWLRFEGCRANQPVPTLRRLKIKKLFVVICLNIPWPDLRLNEQGDLGRFCHAFRIYPPKIQPQRRLWCHAFWIRFLRAQQAHEPAGRSQRKNRIESSCRSINIPTPVMEATGPRAVIPSCHGKWMAAGVNG